VKMQKRTDGEHIKTSMIERKGNCAVFAKYEAQMGEVANVDLSRVARCYGERRAAGPD
jgi:hypothetical protein